MSTAAHDGEAPMPRLIPLRSMIKQEPHTVYPFCISGSRSAECHAEIAEESHEVRIIVHSQHVASPGGSMPIMVTGVPFHTESGEALRPS